MMTMPARTTSAGVDQFRQAVKGGVDSFLELFGIQPPDRVLDDDELGLDLARPSLRQDERRKRFRSDHVSCDAAFFEFDAVVETPR